jgi:hypothetical protein
MAKARAGGALWGYMRARDEAAALSESLTRASAELPEASRARLAQLINEAQPAVPRGGSHGASGRVFWSLASQTVRAEGRRMA